MFIKKMNENEFFTTLDSELTKTASLESDLLENKVTAAHNEMLLASKCLENLGFTKEAQMLITLKEICENPAMQETAPDEMMEQHGFKLVMDDDEEHDKESCKKDDCSVCSDGEQPQLSQSELKRLRELLG